jgi:acetyl esterase/lipase
MHRFLYATCWLALALAGCGDIIEIADVAYDERHGEHTIMDVFLPGDGMVARPAVLFIHGGGWRSFSKDGMESPARRLAGAGYVTASINYRLSPEAVFPAHIQDVNCALAFFRSRADEYGLDPDRVAVMGYSAGGHLASLLGVAGDVAEFQPDCSAGVTGPPNAVISGAGPEDMALMPQGDAVTEFLGGTLAEIPEIYTLASPIAHVDAGEPPFLLVHGTGDWFVDIEQSEAMRDVLRAAGNDARLLSLRGGGHLLNTDAGGDWQLQVSTDAPEAWAVITDFLHQTIGEP